MRSLAHFHEIKHGTCHLICDSPCFVHDAKISCSDLACQLRSRHSRCDITYRIRYRSNHGHCYMSHNVTAQVYYPLSFLLLCKAINNIIG